LGKLPNITNWIGALDDFYTEHPFVDWCKTIQNEGHFQHFSERIGFCTWCLSITGMQLHTKKLCKSLRVYGWLDLKWLGIHFLFLSKN